MLRTKPETLDTCTVEECSSRAKSRGMCSKHYQRWAKYGDATAGATGHGELLTWLEKSTAHNGDECLTWPFGRSSTGYGHVKYNGKITNASRVMCILVHGEPPTPEYQAAHSCGSGHLGCVNPKHLRWATQSENMQEMVLHGRRGRVQAHQIARIRKLGASGLRPTEIGRLVGVSRTTVRFILSGRTWSYVEAA